jgi:hypothetical protein
MAQSWDQYGLSWNKLNQSRDQYGVNWYNVAQSREQYGVNGIIWLRAGINTV